MTNTGNSLYEPNKKHGYMLAAPNVPATEQNANGRLINRDVPGNDPFQDIYMYVDNVKTGWVLSGTQSQVRGSNTFYPKNVQQIPITISGICPNQYEYDRLVRFVQNHQQSMQDPAYSGTALQRVDFFLYPGYDPTGKYIMHPGMAYGGHITTIRAGHERFKFYPSFDLLFTVTYDYLSPPNTQDISVNSLVDQYTTSLSSLGFYGGTPTGRNLVTLAGATANVADTITQAGQYLVNQVQTGFNEASSFFDGLFS